MNELQQLTPEQEREMEHYGDGVEAGINMILRELKRAYDESPDLWSFGQEAEELLRNHGIELTHGDNTDK